MKTTSSPFYNAIYYFSLFVFVTVIPVAHPLYAAADSARPARDVVQVAPPLLDPDMRTTVQIAVINVGRTVRRAGAHRPFPQTSQPQASAVVSITDISSAVGSNNAASLGASAPRTSISMHSIPTQEGMHIQTLPGGQLLPGDADVLFMLDQPNIN